MKKIICLLIILSLINLVYAVEETQDMGNIGNPSGLKLPSLSIFSLTVVGGYTCSVNPEVVNTHTMQSSTTLKIKCAVDGHNGCVWQVWEMTSSGGWGAKVCEVESNDDYVYCYGLKIGQTYVYQRFYCDEKEEGCFEVKPWYTVGCGENAGCKYYEVKRQRQLTGDCPSNLYPTVGCFNMEDREFCGYKPECQEGYQKSEYCQGGTTIITKKCVGGKLVETGEKCIDPCEYKKCGDLVCDSDCGETLQSCASDCDEGGGNRAEFIITSSNIDKTHPEEGEQVTATVKVKNIGSREDDSILEFGIYPTSWDWVKTLGIIDESISKCCPLNKYSNAKRVQLKSGEEIEVKIAVNAPTKDSIDNCNKELVSAWSAKFKPVIGLYRECGKYDAYQTKGEISVGDSADSGKDEDGKNWGFIVMGVVVLGIIGFIVGTIVPGIGNIMGALIGAVIGLLIFSMTPALSDGIGGKTKVVCDVVITNYPGDSDIKSYSCFAEESCLFSIQPSELGLISDKGYLLLDMGGDKGVTEFKVPEFNSREFRVSTCTDKTTGMIYLKDNNKATITSKSVVIK